ncbi:MAG: AAA family ATPase [Candidatus Bathyarchaeota archaeon]|nr:AAA family ATPase [Candidatus Bathyarchaeota archaeon]
MDKPLILNEDAFAEVFIPSRVLHRDEQIGELKRRLSPALENRSVENIFLTGTSGTGKTAIAKHILENHFKSIAAYVNCWKHRTTYEVLTEILLSLQVPVHGRESTGELAKKLERVIQTRKIIVCLDEVDRLNDFDLLYLLARNGCGLILISTRCHTISSLSPRIRSRLALTEVEFPTYDDEEIYNIVKDRVEFAMRPGTLKNELLRMASVAAQGDARTALEIIRKAGKKAEFRGLDEIAMNELQAAISETSKFSTMQPLNKLNSHQKILYQILERHRKMPSGLLYDEYRTAAQNPVVDRAYRNYMRRMVKHGLIKSEGKGRWKSYEIIA